MKTYRIKLDELKKLLKERKSFKMEVFNEISKFAEKINQSTSKEEFKDILGGLTNYISRIYKETEHYYE